MQPLPLYNAHYHQVDTISDLLRVGECLLLTIVLENAGLVPWLNFGQHPVALAYRLLTADGHPVVQESSRTPLPAPVPPGGHATVEMRVIPPDEPGDYRLQIDLLEEGVTWFSAHGVAPLEVTFTLKPATAPRACIINGNVVMNDAVGNHVVTELLALRQAGFDTLVLTEFIDGRLSADVRCSMVHLQLADLIDPEHAAADERVQRAIRHFFAADVVLLTYSTYYNLAHAIKLVHNSVVIFDYHGVTPPEFWDRQSEGYDHLVRGQQDIALVAYADYAIARSEYMRRELLATGLIAAERVTVTPLGNVQNPVTVQLNDPDPELLARHDLLGKHVLLYVGRMARNKCIHVLVGALAQIRHQHPDTVLLLVGNNEAAPYRDYVAEVQHLAAELNCAEGVIFTGAVPSVSPYFDLCHLFVTASVHEGFGMPVIEAMARGKPVVAAAAAALPETVGDSGLLFAPYDAAELATKVCELLEQVPPHAIDTRPQHPLLAAATAHVGDKPLLDEGQTIGFVTPRYGTAILGGAERLIRGWAEELARRGYPVEVLTTCTARMDDWSNHYSPGVEQINGVTVRRFATDRVNSHVFHAVMERANEGERVSYQDEQAFAQNNLQSTDLNAYLREHSTRFVCVFFAPYLFGTTYWGAQQVLGKAMLVPCMHDEASARLLVFREMLEEAHGIFFNTEAESEFTSTELGLINPFRTVVGYGFDVDLPSGDGDAFRARYNLPAQFLLYSGRLEYGKNVPLLLDYFVRYKEEYPGDLTLVLTGSGNVPIPPRPDIVALGVLPEKELPDAFAAALALCQPSRNESFSIVMMESWLQRRPCIVHACCPVTSGHVHSSGGGSIFDDYDSFCAAIEQLRHNPSTADLKGQRGYRYVRATYAWDAVIARLLEGITQFTRPTSSYERLARCGVRRALDFAPQRFDDAFLAVVHHAYSQRFGLNQQQRHQLQQAIRAVASGTSISPAPDGRVRAQLRQWSQRVMGFLGIASPGYRQNEQQARFNRELVEMLLPMLDQNFAEQRRLHREIALLRSQLRSPADNATMEDPSQHNHLA